MNMFSTLLLSSRQSVAYMIGEITKICREMKLRSPGSEGEHETAEYMAGLLRTECGCSDVKVESFREHPASFYGYCRISGVLDVLSCVGFFIHPGLSLIAACFSFFLFIFHFVLYKPILDPFFPVREGTNVTAVRPCRGDVRQRIFLNGHIDAAWEFTLNYHFGGVVFEIPNVVALLGVSFYLILSICSLCGAGTWIQTAARWGILFLPFFIVIWFTFNPKRIVDGAKCP